MLSEWGGGNLGNFSNNRLKVYSRVCNKIFKMTLLSIVYIISRISSDVII